MDRDSVEHDVAANPARAPSGCSQRRAALDGRKGESKPRDQDHALDRPRREVVVHHVKIGRAVFQNGALHFGECRVHDSVAQGLGLALELERGIARRTDIVDGSCALGRRLQTRRFAGWTKEILCAPRFRPDAGTLRSALVAFEASGGQMQIHSR